MREPDISPQQSREHSDPQEAPRPIPAWVLVMAALLVILCVYYIARSGPTGASVYGDHRTVSDLAAKPKSAAGTGSAVDGAAIFAARCAPCHQATGTGLPGVFPPLAGSNWVNGHDTTLMQILLHGITGTLTVNGKSYNGSMPAFGTQLSDAEIAAVLTHIRGQWGNKGEAVSASEVGTQRAVERRRRFNEGTVTRMQSVTRTSWMGTGLSPAAACVFAAAAIWSTTFGLQAWTTEEIRRLRVQAEPPVLSALQLRPSDGASVVPWGQPKRSRHVWLMTFIYTRCPTLCTTLGIEFERLQRTLGQDPRDADIGLLSISFDPAHDDVRALEAYAAEHHADPARWTVAVPSSAAALAQLEREAGIVVISDGLGGYAHNAAIHVVLDEGRLVRIFGFDNPEGALACARRL